MSTFFRSMGQNIDTRPTSARNQPRREHLLNTAWQLFNVRGYHATGIDTIMEASGVSKTTLYKYFASKEELILEVLRRRHEELLAHFQNCIAQSRLRQPDLPDEQHIFALFDALHEWINSGQFFGCNFINASAEYGAPDEPIHQLACEHKKKLGRLVFDLLSGRSAGERKALAENILLVMDGTIVAAHVRGDKRAAKKSRTIVQAMLNL